MARGLDMRLQQFLSSWHGRAWLHRGSRRRPHPIAHPAGPSRRWRHAPGEI